MGIETFQPAPGSKLTRVGARDANGKTLYDIDNEKELDSQTVIDGPFKMFKKAVVIPPAIDSKASAPVFWDETVQVLPVRWQETSYVGLPTIGIKARVDSYPDSLAVDVLLGHRKWQDMLSLDYHGNTNCGKLCFYRCNRW